ncbi:MAG: hypothetical protein AAF664_12200 [Planctomycetota bacterium]
MGLRSAFDLLLGSEDSLQGMEDLIWQSLLGGASSKKHPWNEGTFSTAAMDGPDRARPKSRTVILRKADRSTLSVDFHTDIRSAKIDQLENQDVCWLFYATVTKMQLRLEGSATIIDGAEADRAWAQTSLGSRSAYLSLAPPGTVVPDQHPPDTSDRSVSSLESERGRVNFRIVRTFVTTADWLYLKREGHVRARLNYQDSGKCDCCWLVP